MGILTNIEHTVGVLDEQEVTDLLDWCMDADNEGSHYHGMTYEQGIRDAIDWLSGETDSAPHREE